MANLVDCLTVPSSSLRPILSPLIACSISSYSRSSVRLPKSRGLKLSFTSHTSTTTCSVGSVTRSKLASTGIIVCEAQDTAVEVLAVNDQTWKSMVLESESPVLVEFWAPWCGPCRMMHPVVDAIAREYVGKLKCYKLNTDESPSVASQYGIRSIPTVMIFKDGEKKDAIIGAVPQTTLTTSIDKFL